MIRLFGDLHGNFHPFRASLDDVPADYAVIQVGDFGAWPEDHPVTKASNLDWSPPTFGRRVYWCDGNHEYFPAIDPDGDSPQEIAEDTFYVPRGAVVDIHGVRVGFLGGAESIDAHMRTEGVSWFREETLRYVQALKILDNGPVDLLVTHTPTFDMVGHISGIKDPRWNHSAKLVQAAWDALGRPPMVSGHLHDRWVLAGAAVLEIQGWIDFDPQRKCFVERG